VSPGQLLAQPRLGEHPAVAHHDHPLQAKALPHPADLRGKGHRIAGVAVRDLHRHRASLDVRHHTDEELGLTPPPVTGMAPLDQRRGLPLVDRRRDVVEDQRALP
jgi:hypothetical protein